MYLACLWWLIILTAVKIISKWTFSRFHTQFLISFIYQGTAAFSIWEVCLTDQASAASRALPVLSELQLKDVRAECRFLSDFVVAASVQSWCCQLLLSAILHPLFPSTPLQAAGAELLMLISPSHSFWTFSMPRVQTPYLEVANLEEKQLQMYLVLG